MLAFVSGWDAAVLLGAAYFAIVLLVRLMRDRRDQLVRELQTEASQEQMRKKVARRRRRKQEIRDRQIRSQMTGRQEQAS